MQQTLSLPFQTPLENHLQVLCAFLLMVGTCNCIHRFVLYSWNPLSLNKRELGVPESLCPLRYQRLTGKGIWNPNSLSRSWKSSKMCFMLQSSYEIRLGLGIILDSLPLSIYCYKSWYSCDEGVLHKYFKGENDKENGININSWWISVKGIWAFTEFSMFEVILT